MSEVNDLQPTFVTLRETIPPPAHMAKNRAAFLQQAKTVTENAPVRPLGWSAPAFPMNGFGRRHTPMSKRTIIAVTIALMMASTALAQQLIQFYAHNDDDHTDVTLHYNSEDHVPVQAVWPALADFANTLPYAAKMPTFLPSGYTVEASHYTKDLQMLQVIYQCDGNPEYGFELDQLPSSVGLAPGDVGASAIVETVQVGDVSGQVVKGGWTVVEPKERPEGAASVQADMTWDNNTPMFMLNWEAEGMRYTLFSILGSTEMPKNPTCLLDSNTGVKIASSLATYTP